MDEKWDWRDHIESKPDVLGGRPVIRGTRVPVQVLVGVVAGGASVTETANDYLVTEEDVRAALAYAAQAVAQSR